MNARGCTLLLSASHTFHHLFVKPPHDVAHTLVLFALFVSVVDVLYPESLFLSFGELSPVIISSEAPLSLFLLPAYVWFIPPYRSHFTLISGLPALL